MPIRQTYFFDESVLAFVLERKCGSFCEHKEGNTLVTPYCLVWGVPYPMLNTSVGYCLFVFRSFHNLRSDRLINSTLSVYIPHHRGVAVAVSTIYHVLRCD